MKAFILKQMRRGLFQPLWEALSHVSRMGQNHWASSVTTSGEVEALKLLARTIPAGGILFDVGSNAGQYAVEAAAILKPAAIYAFEPSRAAFAALGETIAAYGLDGIVRPLRLALGDHAGAAILHSSEAGATIGSLLDLRNPYAPFQAEADEEVIVATLDDFCKERGIERIDLLKIDVEGAELAVLKGASRLLGDRRIGAIQFEFGEGHIDARTYMRDFFDILGKEYALHRIVSDGLRPIPHYSAELEVFAVINYLAILKPLA